MCPISNPTDISTAQPLDSDLTSLALLGSAADKTVYTTALHTWAETGFTSAGRAMSAAATAAAQTALLSAVIGDSGSGGTKGLVPAPSAGDAAAVKFLKADGTWATPSGGGLGDVVGPASSTDNAAVRFDSTTGKLVQDSVVIIGDTGAITGVLSIAIPNAGLLMADTNASHNVTLKVGTDITAARDWTLSFGDAARTLTMTSNTSLGGGTHSGTNTGDQTTVSGNAGTATALATPRAIGGVNFDGTAAIVPQTIESANEATDTTCFPLFITASGTQQLQPKNNTTFVFNSNTSTLGATNLTGTLTTASQTAITGVGTLTTGTWSATAIAETKGGTNQTTYAAGDLLYASASNTLSKLAVNSTATNKFLRTVSSGAPSWQQVADADLSFTDVATNNASTSAHGFLKKLSNTATEFMNGAGNWATPTTGAIEVQTFNSSGTWTKPGSGTYAIVLGWGTGASGGSGNSTTNKGGGGGGGGYNEGIFLLSDLGSTETVTIAAAAAAVTIGDGNAGGNCTFGSWLTAYGGGRGGGSINSGAGGGGGGYDAVGGNATGATPGAGGGTWNFGAAGTSGNAGGAGLYGGGGGADDTTGTGSVGGAGNWSGGGGGSGCQTVGGSGGAGGAAFMGGAGGGGSSGTGTGGAGGVSRGGGGGGAGASNGSAATAGTAPGGGGGGTSNSGTSGAGAKGRIVVIVI